VAGELPEKDRIGENAFEMPPFYIDNPEMRRHFARVYNSIKLTDNKIGVLLSRLEKDHLKDSTIIFFFRGSRGRDSKGKNQWHQPRIPRSICHPVS
jgi:arylsulfatase A-like enzyme